MDTTRKLLQFTPGSWDPGEDDVRLEEYQLGRSDVISLGQRERVQVRGASLSIYSTGHRADPLEMQGLSDEIESVLFIAREVMGPFVLRACVEHSTRRISADARQSIRSRPEPLRRGTRLPTGTSSRSCGRAG